MKPTIPGFQNSWQPAVRPLPPQAPAAPAGLDPAAVYSFGSGTYAPLPAGNRIPVAPAAPGYIGPASAMAYQMAGPRVGFGAAPPAGGAPAAGGPPPIQGSGGIEGNQQRGIGGGLFDNVSPTIGLGGLVSGGATWNPASSPFNGGRPGFSGGPNLGNPDLYNVGAGVPGPAWAVTNPQGGTLQGALQGAAEGARLGSGLGLTGSLLGGLAGAGASYFGGSSNADWGSNSFGGGDWSSFGGDLGAAFGGFEGSLAGPDGKKKRVK